MAQEKPRELLKAIDASDKWQVQKENEEKARPPASASKEYRKNSQRRNLPRR